jgi:prevent-host-death family protein
MSAKTRAKSATFVPADATMVGVRDLRDHLSAFLERVKAGETITITEHGRPIARLVRDAPPSARLLELANQGRVTLATKPPMRWDEIPHVRYEGSIEDLMDEIR